VLVFPPHSRRPKDDELVLGDFGIVFLPSVGEPLTETRERVGPRDYMAPWMDRGERVEDVHTCSDVYMLGKLLWCMISGKLKLSRENHRRKEFNGVRSILLRQAAAAEAGEGGEEKKPPRAKSQWVFCRPRIGKVRLAA
jgi:serine/threonine protein kinase